MSESKNHDQPFRFEDIAVAVKYNFGAKGEAPTVIASGRGFLASRIKTLAQEHEVPVVAEKPLAESLAQVPVGSEIPAELWEAMAAVLAHLYSLDGSLNR
ncbi:MAG TPA: EscU/YscU/HrcU family type III secretion system export apparatus switch protein [Candidatus Ozemobacteraceae bacterium]|nr:EscU/YscU/HrcU family type III secretion system export apparatus switch protein [Candidatus Ozemobacteraceae bacterium]